MCFNSDISVPGAECTKQGRIVGGGLPHECGVLSGVSVCTGVSVYAQAYGKGDLSWRPYVPLSTALPRLLSC